MVVISCGKFFSISYGLVFAVSENINTACPLNVAGFFVGAALRGRLPKR